MAKKPFADGGHITEKMKLNFLGNIFHKHFTYTNRDTVLTSRVDAKKLLSEYVKQVTENEMPNPKYDKQQQRRLDFAKRTLREFVDKGYMTMDKGVCEPTDKFWNQDEFKSFYAPFKELIVQV